MGCFFWCLFFDRGAGMKLIPVNYYGFTAMDRRFSSPMLPWIVSEIRKRDYCEKVRSAGTAGTESHCNSLAAIRSAVELRCSRSRSCIVFAIRMGKKRNLLGALGTQGRSCSTMFH